MGGKGTGRNQERVVWWDERVRGGGGGGMERRQGRGKAAPRRAGRKGTLNARCLKQVPKNVGSVLVVVL